MADVDVSGSVEVHRAQGVATTLTGVEPPGRLGALVLGADEGNPTVWEREPLERPAHGGQLAACKHGGFWHPMDTLRDAIVLEQASAAGAAPWKVWS